MIYTKIHHLRDTIRANQEYERRKSIKEMLRTGVESVPTKVFVDLPTDVPHIVLTPEVVDAMHQDDVAAMVEDLYISNELGMPFKTLILEMDIRVGKTKDDPGKISRVFYLLKETDWDKYDIDLYLFNQDGVIKRSVTTLHVQIYRDPTITRAKSKMCYRKTNEGWSDSWASCAVAAWSKLIVLMLTKGTIREAIPAEKKLNKVRAARGQSLIPAYTVFRIGHIQTKSGEDVTYHPGSKMRPHWRRRHTRNQFFGPGRAQHKEITIQAVWVNKADVTDPSQFIIPPKVLVI